MEVEEVIFQATRVLVWGMYMFLYSQPSFKFGATI